MNDLSGAENWTAYLLALLAGLIYAGGAIAGKKALETGCGQVRTVILSNLILSVCFIPHFFLSPGWPTLTEWITGAGLGSIFLLAQALLFRALRAGDASMVSPLMGIKSILVAFFLVILGFSHEPLSTSTWIAAGLTAVAVGLIGWPAKNSGRASAKGILLALASAAAFSLLDSMVPHFSHQTDPVRMLFCIFGSLGFLTLILLPWKEEPLFRRGNPGDKWAWREWSFNRSSGRPYVHCHCLLPGAHRSKCGLFKPGFMDPAFRGLVRKQAGINRRVPQSLGQSKKACWLYPTWNLYSINCLRFFVALQICADPFEQNILN